MWFRRGMCSTASTSESARRPLRLRPLVWTFERLDGVARVSEWWFGVAYGVTPNSFSSSMYLSLSSDNGQDNQCDNESM